MGKFVDLTGKRFGSLTVIQRVEDHVDSHGVKNAQWECKCDCGNEIVTRGKYLTCGRKKYCSDMCRCKREDITGKRFGKLTVLSRIDYGRWLCRCDCGNEIELMTHKLTSGNNKSCGKCSRAINMIGERYGRLEVVEQSEPVNGKVMWKCLCDCGKYIVCDRQSLTYGYKRDCGCRIEENQLIGKRYGRLVIKNIIRQPGEEAKAECICDCGNITIPSLTRVINNKVKSCGCLVPDISQLTHTTHGKSKSRIYKIWKKMNDRCNNPNNKDYDKYGGRGVKICVEWTGEHGAENFINWAYSTGYDENAEKGECTLDRINVNGNYDPDNCRWANMEEQSYNRRNTIRIDIYGKLLTIKEISDIYGIPKGKIRQRYFCGIRDEKKLLYNGDLRELK